MNIAICDDTSMDAAVLEEIVESVFMSMNCHYKCDLFTSGDDLLAFVEKKPMHYQIYLLDIEMPGTNGMETASQIRQQDADAIIIFVTHHEQMMAKAFQVLAFQFITKPYDANEASTILMAAIDYLHQKKALFQFSQERKTYMIPLSQIMYIERIHRKIVIHSKEGASIEFYGTLRETKERLPSLTFAQAHGSYIVNMEQIVFLSSSKIIMCDQLQINIGVKFREEFFTAFRRLSQLRTYKGDGGIII